MATTLAINGRFLSQPVSGVQRYARELIDALDGALTSASPGVVSSATIWVPPNVSVGALPSGLQVLKVRKTGRLTGHLWEQVELPRATANAFLVSLTNSAPLLHPSQLVTIHDAAIREYPGDFKWAYRAWYRGLYAGLRRTQARFISVSTFAAAEVSRQFGIPADRIAVVPNAAGHFLPLRADHRALTDLGLPEHGYVLAFGGGSRRKNLTLIERAFAQLDPRPLLVIVGGGASRVFATRGSPIAGSVYLDDVSDATIKALYQGALCLAFPSLYEGFGLPPIEAMACGCPVIASRAASMPEVCGNAALYCDPNLPETLAAGIRRLLCDPDLRSELILRGTERAQQFSWDASARKLLDIVRAATPIAT